MIKRILTWGMDKVKRNTFIQNLFEAPFNLNAFPVFCSFTTSDGDHIELRNGLRSKIRPGWQSMLTDTKSDITDDGLRTMKQHGNLAVERLTPLLRMAGTDWMGARVLEVGCHSASATFAIADRGAEHVTGTEFAGYKVDAVDKSGISDEKLIAVNEELESMRTRLAGLYSKPDRVRFQDDICRSRLEPDSYDIICSWEVLEHIHDPAQAFLGMASLLKPGGVMVHEYNPFFCLNGGHSLCTLDMLWGHARLSESDFRRYLETIRPVEADRDLAFFTNGLNRMSLSQLDNHLRDAGLDTIGIFPFTKEQHVKMLDAEIIRQAQSVHSDLTPLDLCAPRVFVLARRRHDS